MTLDFFESANSASAELQLREALTFASANASIPANLPMAVAPDQGRAPSLAEADAFAHIADFTAECEPATACP